MGNSSPPKPPFFGLLSWKGLFIISIYGCQFTSWAIQNKSDFYYAWVTLRYFKTFALSSLKNSLFQIKYFGSFNSSSYDSYRTKLKCSHSCQGPNGDSQPGTERTLNPTLQECTALLRNQQRTPANPQLPSLWSSLFSWFSYHDPVRKRPVGNKSAEKAK